MNVLLLGGTGTLSFEVLNLSLKKGYNVTIINRGNNNKFVDKRVHILKADLYNADAIMAVISNNTYDVVVDFFSRKASDIARLFPVFSGICKQYMFISTACVYDRTKLGDFPITENTEKPNMGWSYSIQKYEAEILLRKLCSEKTCCFTIVRPYITYNEKRIPFGITPANYGYHRTIIERILEGKPMFVWGNGSMRTTVTHTTDFAKGVIGLFLNDKAKNEDFHVTTEESHTVMEILLELYKQLGKEPNIVNCSNEDIEYSLPSFKGMLEGDRSLNAVFDNTKIKVAIPWLTFDVSLSDGISKILAYYNESKEFLYDYQYDAQVDKLLSGKGLKLSYVQYRGGHAGHRLEYILYRYFPQRLAKKIVSVLRIKKQ